MNIDRAARGFWSPIRLLPLKILLFTYRYKDKERWNKMALVNIAKAGVFASDRSIEDYAQGIWNLRKVKKAKTTKQ